MPLRSLLFRTAFTRFLLRPTPALLGMLHAALEFLLSRTTATGIATTTRGTGMHKYEGKETKALSVYQS